MSANRNFALAQTQPDTGRSSYVRVTSGRRPLSLAMAIDATHIRQLADDIATGVVTGERLPHMLRQLATRIEQLEAVASSLEDVACQQMGVVR